jgi:hypothetical protein
MFRERVDHVLDILQEVFATDILQEPAGRPLRFVQFGLDAATAATSVHSAEAAPSTWKGGGGGSYGTTPAPPAYTAHAPRVSLEAPPRTPAHPLGDRIALQLL